MAWDKHRMRRERAARMEVLGYTDAEIAAAIGITPPGLAMLKRHPQYRDILASVKDGFIREMDLAVGSDTQALRERIRTHLPAALEVIFNNIQQTKDRKLAQTAAETLIGIDGRFAKVTRVGVPTEDQGGVGTDDDEVVNNILKGIKKHKEEQAKLEATVSDVTTIQ